MVVTCPQLLLSDVRNVVVPSLQYMLQSTSDHDELGKRLFRDPSLLVVGVGPLARLQYTLEQHRNGTASIATGNLAAAVGPEASETSTAGNAYFDTPWVGAGGGGKAETATRKKKRKSKSKSKSKGANGKDMSMSMSMSISTGDLSLAVEEDQTRLLPPVIVPQVSSRRRWHAMPYHAKQILRRIYGVFWFAFFFFNLFNVICHDVRSVSHSDCHSRAVRTYCISPRR